MELKHGDLINQLTLKEKVSLLSGKNFWETQEIDRLGIKSIFLADGPHGIRKQMASADHLGLNESIKATCFPTASALSCSWNKDLLQEVGRALGIEAKRQDVSVLLGPGINIKRNPLAGRNFEYLSEDPYLAGKLGASLIQGIQTYGTAACVKHYACNSQELRRMVSNSVVDERALREIYLTNFEIAVKEGNPQTVMSAYNLLNGVYANENTHLMREILRDEWKYEGVVVTDWGGENNRVDGLIAGNELEMPTSNGENNLKVKEAVENGTLDEKYLDEAVDRLLTLIENSQKVEAQELDIAKHHELALKAAEECIVLLRNENDILPLKKDQKVAFIGKFIEEVRHQGAGSSQVNSYKVDTYLDNLDKYGFTSLGYEKGFEFNDKVSKKLEKKAVQLAEKSDVICLFLGLDSASESEGLDRKDMSIPANQLHLLDKLLPLNKKIVVVLTAGSAIEIPFVDKVDAIVHAFLSGEAVAKAVLDILAGNANPSGKLSETYPLSYKDTNSYNYWHKKTFTSEYRESIYVGYRYYDKNNINVLYPFGYGLSYTTFEYSNLKISKDGVRFNVKNIGEVEGKEISQLYIGKKESNVYRAVKELKGFTKTSLKPGEEKEVFIPFDDYSFRYFDVDTNAFEVEDGEYQIYVGKSSRDIVLEDSYEVKGKKDVISKKDSIPSYYDGNVSSVSDEEYVKVLGYELPDSELHFIKKNRIVVDDFTTVEHLRYSRGWVGRVLSWAIRSTIARKRRHGKKKDANTLEMGMLYQPVRGFIMAGIFTLKQIEGIKVMCNGHFFKGLKIMIKGRKKKEDNK